MTSVPDHLNKLTEDNIFDTHSYQKLSGFIILAALIVRVLWSLMIEVIPVSDSFAYDNFALTLSEYGVYGWSPEQPSAYWPVGTSAIYALFYTLFGHSYTPIIIFNLIIGLLIIILCMELTKIWFGKTIALSAGILLALWPSQIQFTTVLASELIFNVLMLAAIYLLSLNRKSILDYIIIGVLIALTAYIRPTALLFPFIFAFFLWIKNRTYIDTLQFLIVSFIVMSVVIAPWSIRNTQLFGTFVPISTNGGPNMWMGNNPETTGFYQELPKYTDHLSETERDKLLREEAKNYIIDEPGAFVVRTVIKAVRLYERETIGVVWNKLGIEKAMGEKALTPIKIISQFYWIICLFFSLVGFVILYKRIRLNVLIHPAIIMISYFTLVHAVIVVQDRYHFSVIPFIAMLASLSIATLYSFIKNKKSLI